MDNILVSIRCITYNHALYIRQCLDGFVMQKTNFRFEAIVHDDASTDGTADIVREYAEKYPEIIKPIFQTENQYSKRDGSIRRALNAAMSPSSKYVAMCEGDDYWTDPYKLQKQVDFLEGHPEYSMCFHNAMVHWENGQFPDAPFAKLEDRDYIGEEIYENWIVPTASVVFRKKVLKSALYVNASTSKMFVHGDIILFLSCAAFGKIRGVRDIMSVYRRHVGGVTFIKNMSMLTAQVRHNKNIPRYFGDKYLQLSKKRIAQVSIFAFLSTKLRYWDFLKIAWENSRKFTCVFLMQGIHSWLKVHLRIDV